MQPLYHELAVLAKAVHFKNLSAAALHVGLSQPQLSRIIAKIEDELQIILLDRSAKRKSGWTQAALQLAEIFEKSNKRLETEIRGVNQSQMVNDLHIGTLEGLASLAIKATRNCFDHIGVRKVSLDIYDLSELEAHFMAGNIDLIFTSKMPGRQKFKNLVELGYQDMEQVSTNEKYTVLSTFEYNRLSKKEPNSKHVLVSNSLAIRKEWFEEVGGTGTLISTPKRGSVKDREPVVLIGSELLAPALWSQIVDAIEIS